jgi:hypothetical protein
MEAVRPGGQVVFLGKVNINEDVAFRWGSLMGEKQIVRSSYGGARPRRDFPWLARQYLEGKLKLDELVTRRIPLEEINSGFDAMRRGETVREVVVFPTISASTFNARTQRTQAKREARHLFGRVAAMCAAMTRPAALFGRSLGARPCVLAERRGRA